jgi:hypothetical protein
MESSLTIPAKALTQTKRFMRKAVLYCRSMPPKDEYLFLADKWNKLDLQQSTYTWLPLTITADRPVIHGK